MRRALGLAAAAVLALPGTAAAVTVYAAASLRDAFPAIDGSPTFSFAGSNQLQLQIERGAPADVFASASPPESQALYREGRCSKPTTFATNVLVMLAPKSNPARLHSAYGLRRGGLRVAVGVPGVPIGSYTARVLARMRLTHALHTNIVSREPNVSSIVAKVALGSADAGFAYATDGRTASDRVTAIALPGWAQPPVRYQLCAILRQGADGAGARAFIGRVTSTRGRSVLRHAGFGLPPRPR
jgi:molybdate transport system substrate-binding protein